MGGRGRKYSKSHKSQALSEPLDVPAEALCLQLSLPSSADLEQLLGVLSYHSTPCTSAWHQCTSATSASATSTLPPADLPCFLQTVLFSSPCNPTSSSSRQGEGLCRMRRINHNSMLLL